ncbi:hypothetical protein TCE0_044r16966 [Talaromyces pinophilus]|uniref:DUF7702 domain-containing protein n=1 Tax=Talaromyces pinophilus TaxID=128442 RepID=A0A478EBJ1_TALPI|nr:hypothetical protein TCE0_044r16966 [Talaromyces pinophilus]
MVDYRQGLSILEMIVYIPALFMALFMGFRHGFGRQAGWYFFILFSLARLIGNGCYLGTINNPTNINLYIAYAVCNSVGLSPLLLGLLAGLARVNDSIQRKTGSAYWPILFRLVGLISLVAMILSIVGQTTNDSSLEAGYTSSEVKAGIALFIVTWVASVFLTILMWFRYEGIEHGEHRLLWAVTISMAILFVRLLYSILSIFKHDSTFNLFSGNVTVFLVMDVLEEIIVVYIMILTGLTLQLREKAIYDADKELQPTSSAAAENTSQYQTVAMQEQGQAQGVTGAGEAAPRPKRKYKGGPISWLVIFILNKVEGRK